MACLPVLRTTKAQKNQKHNPIFESLLFLYKSTFSKCKGASRASIDRIIYFDKK